MRFELHRLSVASVLHTFTKPSDVPLTIHFPSRDTARLQTKTPLASLPASIGVTTDDVLPIDEERHGFYVATWTQFNFDRFRFLLLDSGSHFALLATVIRGRWVFPSGRVLCSRQQRPLDDFVRLLTALWPETILGPHTRVSDQ